MNSASRCLCQLHLLTQLPQPDGIPWHLVGNGGRKQDPIVYPVLTSHECPLQVTWQEPTDGLYTGQIDKKKLAVHIYTVSSQL